MHSQSITEVMVLEETLMFQELMGGWLIPIRERTTETFWGTHGNFKFPDIETMIKSYVEGLSKGLEETLKSIRIGITRVVWMLWKQRKIRKWKQLKDLQILIKRVYVERKSLLD